LLSITSLKYKSSAEALPFQQQIFKD